MNAKSSGWLSLATALLVSACSASDPIPAAAPTPAVSSAFVINTHGQAGTESSRAAMDVLTDEASRAVLSPRSSLVEAEAGAVAALASTEGLSEAAASELRQTVASVMVQRYLAQPTPDAEAVGRYTEVLLTEDSPNAHLIASALPVVEASWGRARTSAAAGQAASEATAYLDRTCPGCNAEALARGQSNIGPAEAPDAAGTQRAIQDGIAALETL